MRLLLLTAMAWAEEHGAEHLAEHHEVIIPWKTIFIQTFNFSLLFGLLFYLLRNAVKAHFAERAQTYQELVDRAENARKEAEASHTQIKQRLATLEASAEQSVSRAKSEAEQLRARMLDDAKALSKKLEQDTQRAAAVELERAKAELRKELLDEAIDQSYISLKKGLGSVDQKKLQNEFVAKIEVVSE